MTQPEGDQVDLGLAPPALRGSELDRRIEEAESVMWTALDLYVHAEMTLGRLQAQRRRLARPDH